ncbi:MAG: hypothetical protein PHV18_05075 [Lachnospiraceae bacterium]|nr:hypothetical protein [Lachnospiraceae bacterium]
MARKSVIEKAENMIGKINPHYTLRTNEIVELHNGSEYWFRVIVNSFRYGYMQGMKAAKAEMKKQKTA